MRTFTTEELRQTAEALLASRFRSATPAEQLNLNFHPTVEACDGENRTLTLRFHTYPWMANPNNMTHGGIIAAVFDNSMGLTSIIFCGDMTPTVTMTVNYTRPVPLDRDVLVKVQVIHTGSTTAQFSAEMTFPGEPNAPAATASGIYHCAHLNRQK